MVANRFELDLINLKITNIVLCKPSWTQQLIVLVKISYTPYAAQLIPIEYWEVLVNANSGEPIVANRLVLVNLKITNIVLICKASRTQLLIDLVKIPFKSYEAELFEYWEALMVLVGKNLW